MHIETEFEKYIPISKLGKIVSGGTPDTGNLEYWDGGVLWCVPSDITNSSSKYLSSTKRTITEPGLKSSSANLLPPKSLLVCTRATIGEMAINILPMATNQGFKNVIPYKDVSVEYILYALCHSKRLLQRMSCGSTFLELSKSDFSKIEIPDLEYPEQKKISEILGACDEAIEAQERLIVQKQQRKKALMQQLLTGKTRFPKLVGKPWKNLELKSLLKETPRKCPKPEGTFKSIGVRSHAKGTFLKHDMVPDEIALTELFEVHVNDIVVNISFAWEHAIGVAKQEDHGALVSHRFPTFVCKPGIGDPSYFRHFVQMPRIKYDLKCVSPGGAGRNRVLNKKDFMKLTYKFPEYQEQRYIGNALDDMDADISGEQRKLDKLKQQKKGLMQQLLTGKVRVKV